MKRFLLKLPFFNSIPTATETNLSTPGVCSNLLAKNTLLKEALAFLLGLHHHLQDNLHKLSSVQDLPQALPQYCIFGVLLQTTQTLWKKTLSSNFQKMYSSLEKNLLDPPFIYVLAIPSVLKIPSLLLDLQKLGI